MLDVASLPVETRATLDAYLRLLDRWNRRINLVGRSTTPEAWTRHVAESASLWALHPVPGRWLDIGSGAGLPGLVVGIVSGGQAELSLVESDGRKCAFLQAARRELGLTIDILRERIEALEPQDAAVVTARAFAPLPALLPLLVRHGRVGGVGLFPKGAAWESEVEAARQGWSFGLEVLPAGSAAGSVVLKVWEPHER